MRQVALKAWGNSQAIRIPKEIIELMHLKTSDVLDISIENDAIVLRKHFVHKTFEERMAAYGGTISVCDFDWGDPKGKEIL
ncbi:MAG: AbrB/MazE/SpoVT family DNA-binding domain-containing protein [Clostridia bacterium]|nr:AbrB/MazE/SpoVT family DNA-binding domain-containing protein [Clostridia bacterium]